MKERNRNKPKSVETDKSGLKNQVSDLYQELIMLMEIEEAVKDVKLGRIMTHQQVKNISKKWLNEIN